jgi:hypothetical protein
VHEGEVVNRDYGREGSEPKGWYEVGTVQHVEAQPRKLEWERPLLDSVFGNRPDARRMKVRPEKISTGGVAVVQDVELVVRAYRCVFAHQLLGVGRSASRAVFNEAIVKSDAHRSIIMVSADAKMLASEL